MSSMADEAFGDALVEHLTPGAVASNLFIIKVHYLHSSSKIIPIPNTLFAGSSAAAYHSEPTRLFPTVYTYGDKGKGRKHNTRISTLLRHVLPT